MTGFGNPDWLRTHSAATSTAPVVSSLLEAGATSLGITIMDEMAYRSFTNISLQTDFRFYKIKPTMVRFFTFLGQ